MKMAIHHSSAAYTGNNEPRKVLLRTRIWLQAKECRGLLGWLEDVAGLLPTLDFILQLQSCGFNTHTHTHTHVRSLTVDDREGDWFIWSRSWVGMNGGRRYVCADRLRWTKAQEQTEVRMIPFNKGRPVWHWCIRVGKGEGWAGEFYTYKLCCFCF
jgi:hypothetical protein